MRIPVINKDGIFTGCDDTNTVQINNALDHFNKVVKLNNELAKKSFNLSRNYISDPSTVVKLHQHVKVKILSVDIERKRIQLSMKDVDKK